MSTPSLRLNDGREIPQIGIGTWPLRDDELPAVITSAIDAGYRHIDTAAAYGNEAGVGQGISDSGIAREELFVTTKIGNDAHGDAATPKALAESLERLGLDYVDLILIHWPMPATDKFVAAWKALIGRQNAGDARSIGVSNFRPAHLTRLKEETGVVPAVNQIEVNPVVTHDALRRFNAELGIVTEAWSPLAPGTDLLNDPRIAGIAEKHGKTPGQVVLRWHVELGLVVIPKSATPSRIRENIEIFDFSLDADDLTVFSGFDRGFPATYAPRLAGDAEPEAS